jgi:formate dehydrogenase (coenzyme F420) alpha subunit
VVKTRVDREKTRGYGLTGRLMIQGKRNYMEQIDKGLVPHAVAAQEIRSAKTVCGICSGTCGMNLTLENGILVTIEGYDDHPVSRGHLCPKGQALPEMLRAPDRLRHPLRKTISGGWEEMSWDQAYGILTQQLNDIRETHGPEALAVHVGQTGVGKEFLPYVERFCTLYGTPNLSTCGSHCYESKSMANILTMGAMPIADYNSSKCIVLWGKNPCSSSPSIVREIMEACERGCILIVVDPRITSLADKADLHLQLRPGTDGALALGMLHVIIKEGLYDKLFVDNWTLGFDKLCDQVAGYTPERVEQITWIPAPRIREGARLYALSSPACISIGVALELSSNGFQAARAVAVLQAITGNIDVAGGAVFLKEANLSDLSLTAQNNRKTAIGKQEYPFFHVSTGHAQANLYARAILEERPYPLKGLVVAGSNPVLTWPNALRVWQALANLQFLAVIDPFMTETAKLAQLVLPCATFLGGHEIWDSSHLSLEPRLGLAPKLFEEEGLPTNWEIWKEIATRMGHSDFFPWNTEEEAISFRVQSMNLTFEDLRQMPAGYTYHQWTEKKYEKEHFKTASGKVEIYSAELKRYGYEPLPAYTEPAESPVSTPDIARLYPLVLTTGARRIEYLHSQFRNVPSLLLRAPEPYVEINPLTAADLQVEDDEMVAIETLRGRIEVKARHTTAILPGVISIPHGWNERNANVLTDDENLDPVTGFPAVRCLLARIVKIQSSINIHRDKPG